MYQLTPRVVHKVTVPISAERTAVAIPQTAKIVHVAFQDDRDNFVTVWFERQLVANSTEKDRIFSIYATGQNIVAGAEHRGTAISYGFVWHLYEHPTTMQGV